MRFTLLFVFLGFSSTSYAAERRARQPGVEEAAKIILVTPKYRHVLLSAEFCIAQDRALVILAEGKDYDGDGDRIARLLEKNGTPEALPCDEKEVRFLRACLGDKPPVWCAYRWKTDAYVRAAEIEADGGPAKPLDPKRLREYHEYEERLEKDIASGVAAHRR